MIAIYNPMNDVWNNFSQNHEINDIHIVEGRLIIANDRLFLAQVCLLTYNDVFKSISIYEVNIEDKLLDPITEINRSNDMQYMRLFSSQCIFGIGNKISIIRYIKDIVITFDVSTNEEEEIRYNSIELIWHHHHIYPFKYILVSP